MGSGTVEAFLGRVCGILREELQAELAAVWLTGSMVLGDFDAARSDIDLICICRRRLRRVDKLRLSEALSHEALPCPAVGLDLAVLLQGVAESPVCPLPYELGVASGQAWGLDVSLEGQEAELLIDLEICRRHGRSLFGKAPSRLIGAIPQAWLADALNLIVKWHARHIHHPFHDPLGHNAVLNACRALKWAADNQFASKAEAGAWALHHNPDQSVIQQALSIREGNRTQPLEKSDVLTFLSRRGAELRQMR